MLDHAEGAPTRFIVASGGGLSEGYGTWWAWRLPGRWPDGGVSEGYGHDGPGVCLGDDQTEAYLKDMGMAGMAGLAAVWAMARRRRKCTIASWTRRRPASAYDLIPDLTSPLIFWGPRSMYIDGRLNSVTIYANIKIIK